MPCLRTIRIQAFGDRRAGAPVGAALRALRSAAVLGSLAALLAVTPACAAGEHTDASDAGPAQTVYVPPSGAGRIVMVLSGHSGPSHYASRAAEFAQLGYYVVLLDGKDVFNADKLGGERLRKAIARAQSASGAMPGKVAVVGFSQGGGAALAYASRMEKDVAGVIAYYPLTAYMKRQSDGVQRFVDGIKVPVLLFAGEADTYEDCCLIETARAIDTAAKEAQAPLQFVEYPRTAHDFDHADLVGVHSGKGVGYNPDSAADAMARTRSALEKFFGD